MAVLLVGVGTAFAVILPGSNFEIDTDAAGANLKVDGVAPAIDWLAGGSGTAFRSGVVAKNDTPSGATDESFGQGTAEDNPNPTLVDGSIPPSKSDLKAFGVFQEGDEFLELFWSRVQSPQGTTNMDFELNQNKCEHTDDGAGPDYNDDNDPATFDTPTADSICANNGPNTDPTSIQVTPERLAGDKLVAFDLSSGGDDPTITIHTWIDTNGTVDSADHWEDGTCLPAPEASRTLRNWNARRSSRWSPRTYRANSSPSLTSCSTRRR
jgi:hypothetical protein